MGFSMRRLAATVLGLLLLGPTHAAEVVGVGNFSHVVADLDRAFAFYGDVLGLTPRQPPGEFSANPAIMQLGNTPGAQSRIATLGIAGSALGIELIEYKDIARGHQQIRFQDPGATVLQLRVRDLDPILARLEDSQGRIWTPTGQPIAVSETVRIIFLQDPDGIFVELIEDSRAAPGFGNVYGASFELIVADSEAAADFWRRGLGAAPVVGASFDATPALNDNVAAHGAAFRRTGLVLPGSEVAASFLEFRDIVRRPLATRVQDPGTALLQFFVDDVTAMTERLLAAGGELVTGGGGPVDLGGGALLAIVRGPDNLYIELLPRRG